MIPPARLRQNAHASETTGVVSMILTTPGERRRAKRVAINCPVTVEILRPGNSLGLEQGELHDVGPRGARFYLSRALALGARVVMDVHFPNPNKRATTIRFKGVVVRRLREGPPYETSVRFGSRGRFLRDQSEDLFEPETVVDAEATGRWSAR
ncbi:MAG: hypothetical protein DMG27_02765 [Acidobacteria bacterium]|nr:MAG: hypothetical protein DMG27_02765 [Acidobacteriota bacterium]